MLMPVLSVVPTTYIIVVICTLLAANGMLGGSDVI
jgi:hypothetical protein